MMRAALESLYAWFKRAQNCSIWTKYLGITGKKPDCYPCFFGKNLVRFVQMINHKPVIACYLLQYDISSSFHISSLFLSIKGPSAITAEQTLTHNRNSGNIIEAFIPMRPSYVTGSKNFRSKIAIFGL